VLTSMPPYLSWVNFWTKSAFCGCKLSRLQPIHQSLITSVYVFTSRYFATIIFFCPRRHLPSIIQKRVNLTAFMLTFSVVTTLLSVWKPIVNAFALMCLGIPTCYLLKKEMDRVKDKEPRVYDLGVRTMVVFVTAVVVWINDRMFCGFYTSISVTYLHAVWHVLIFL